MPNPGVQYPTISRPLFDNGITITCEVAGASGHALPGSRFVKISGTGTRGKPLVDLAANGGDVFGISGHDGLAVVDGEEGDVTVYHATSIITEVKAGAVLTAGQKVMSDATGQAIVWAGAGAISAGTVIFDCANGAQAAIDRSVGAGQVHA